MEVRIRLNIIYDKGFAFREVCINDSLRVIEKIQLTGVHIVDILV